MSHPTTIKEENKEEGAKHKHPHKIHRSKSDNHRSTFSFYDLIVQKEEAAKHKHPHKIAKDHRSKSDHHRSTLSFYDLTVQKEAKGAPNHRSKSDPHSSTLSFYDLTLQKDARGTPHHSFNQRSLQRSRKFRSKREDSSIWGHHHFLYTVKEEEEGEAEDQHSHSNASFQRRNNDKSKRDNHVSISIMECQDIMNRSMEEGGGALGGMKYSQGQTSLKYTHSSSRGGKGEGGLDQCSYSQASLSSGIYSQGGGGIKPSNNELSMVKKKTRIKFAYNGNTSCYSLFFLYLLHPIKRLRDEYIKCCFSLAGSGDFHGLVGEGHVVGPLFHELFPQEAKFRTPRRDNPLIW